LAAVSGNLETLKKIWEWTKEHLTIEEINNILLLSTDNYGRSVWNLAAERDIWRY
jgi:endo-1,4-beta-D-glucanase Y